jgi:hypothetical protein
LAVAAFAALTVCGAAFPARAANSPETMMGFVNVRDFGARGDGKTDDTAAIQTAIDSLPHFTRRNPFGIRPLYFPNGVYMVSNTLKRINNDGHYAPGLALIGESEANVTLRLKDNAPGFNDPSRPKAVLFFASGLLGSSPTAGGKDYFGLGEGNDAYQNYAESMTIDVGRGNRGAIGIDYLANNVGAIRHVRVVAPESGETGIALTRKWIGPALLKDVSIAGFDIGIDVANTEYSVTLDGVRISGSRQYGIRNTSNSISFANLSVSTAAGIGIANLTPQALLVGRNVRIGGNTTQPILNEGYMNLVGATKPAVATGDNLDRAAISGIASKQDGVYGPSGKIGDPLWHLPVKDAPTVPQYPVKDWADVTQFGAVADPHRDSTTAIQAAMNSGQPVICFPGGIYRITAPVIIPYTVHRIEGSFASVFLDFHPSLWMDQPDAAKPEQHDSGFIVGGRQLPLLLRRLTIRNDINITTNTAKTAILDLGQGPLSLADVVIGEMVAIDRPSTAGEIWAENLVGGKFLFQGRSGVWIRQLNTEGKGVRIRNEGAPLWVLGTKTESNMTLLENSAGGDSELFGGLVYMVHSDSRHVPYLRNTDGKVTAAFAEEAFLPDAVYETFLESTQTGKNLLIKAGDLPLRHNGARMVPQISTQTGAALPQ